MPVMKEIEVFVMIDKDGDYVANTDKGDIDGLFEEQIGTLDPDLRRLICIKLSVPLPEMVTLTGTVPAESAPTGLTVN